MGDDERKTGNVWLGLAVGAGLNVLAILILFTSGRAATVVFAIGLAQLLWMLPAYGAFAAYGQKETAKGVLIAAGICFLLNAACWGLMYGLTGGRISGG